MSCCQRTPTSWPSPRPAWGSWSPATSPPEPDSPWPRGCSSPRWGVYYNWRIGAAQLGFWLKKKKRSLPFPIWSRIQCVFVQAGKSVLDSPFNKVISCCTEAPAYKSALPLMSLVCFYLFLIKLSRNDEKLDSLTWSVSFAILHWNRKSQRQCCSRKPHLLVVLLKLTLNSKWLTFCSVWVTKRLFNCGIFCLFF